jgi:hypothetical protein
MQGMVRMMVNVSPAATAYDETAHVLKFSAIASKVGPCWQGSGPATGPSANGGRHRAGLSVG